MKTMKIITLYLGVILFLFSCSISNDLAPSNSESFQEKLVKEMSEDLLVQEFYSNNEQLMNGFEKFVENKSDKEKKEYLRKLKRKLEKREVSYDFISENDLKDFRSRQRILAQKIKSKYTQLYDLPDEKQESIKSEVMKNIALQKKSHKRSSGGEYEPDCHDIYNSCSWYCYDHNGGDVCENACWAGYLTCTQEESFQP